MSKDGSRIGSSDIFNVVSESSPVAFKEGLKPAPIPMPVSLEKGLDMFHESARPMGCPFLIELAVTPTLSV